MDRGTQGDPVLSFGERIGRFTTDEYFRMIKQGVIREGAPIELLDGLLVLKDWSKKGEPPTAISDEHVLVVAFASRSWDSIARTRLFLQAQGPVCLSSFQAPEPDSAIGRGKPREYARRSRLASDVSSIIEVADSSLEYDRYDKGPKYAEAGILQFILINLIDRVVEIYELPDVKKRVYVKSRVAKLSENVDFLLPDGTRMNVPVTELLL